MFDFGHRPLAAVEANIDAYYRWYPVEGIFFDQASTNCANEPYYATSNRYVKAEGGVARTIINPGGDLISATCTQLNILLTFEGSESAYLHSYSAAAWTAPLSSQAVSAGDLRHPHGFGGGAGRSAESEAAGRFRLRDAGWAPNQYDGLPSGGYWAGRAGGHRGLSRPALLGATNAAGHSRMPRVRRRPDPASIPTEAMEGASPVSSQCHVRLARRRTRPARIGDNMLRLRGEVKSPMSGWV